MENNISIGNYYEASSNIHKMSSVAKVICTILFVLSVLFAKGMAIHLILTLLLIIMILNTNIKTDIYFYALKNMVTALVMIFLIFTFLSFSLILGLTILYKAILIILYLCILTLTTPMTEIIYGLEKTLRPLKKIKNTNINTNLIALNIALGLKYISTFIDQRNRILNSSVIRNIHYENNFLSFVKTFKNLFIYALISTNKKLKIYKEAMTIRLYDVNNQRSNYRMNCFSLFDGFLLGLHVFILISIVVKGVIL